MCIQLACSWRPRAFEEAHRWNIQAKLYNEKFQLVYESDNIWDSLYEEHGATLKHNIWDSLYHGATLKHKCGKRIVALPLLSFLSFFLFFWLSPFLASVLFYFILRPESHPDLWGNHSLHHPFLTWDNALIMMIITLLFTYNSILQIDTRTKIWLYMNASGGVPGYAMTQEWHVWKNYERWLCHKYNVNYMIMQCGGIKSHGDVN